MAVTVSVMGQRLCYYKTFQGSIVHNSAMIADLGDMVMTQCAACIGLSCEHTLPGVTD